MVTINGEKVAITSTISLEEWLVSRNINILTVAVEYNGTLLPKSEFVTTVIKTGDQLEIVSFVGGG